MANKPTPRQLSYLRSLAERTVKTFTYPQTFADAGREIDRLKQPPAGARTASCAGRAQEIADAVARGRAGRRPGAGGRDIGPRQLGHLGAQPPPRARADVDRPAPKRTTPVVGKRTELARYTVAEGERIVYGQRVDGVVRVTDRPATPGGRCLLGRARPADQGRARRPRSRLRRRGPAHGRPAAGQLPVDRYLDAVA